jgi:hypothetical protein
VDLDFCLRACAHNFGEGHCSLGEGTEGLLESLLRAIMSAEGENDICIERKQSVPDGSKVMHGDRVP